MIDIKECNIDILNKALVIKAAVKNEEYYTDVYISKVTIDTDDTFIPNGPSNTSIYTRSFENEKEIELELSPLVLGLDNLQDNVFYVYIEATGTPAPNTPCGKDNIITVGIAINFESIYPIAMNYIREIESKCTIPTGFIDMILKVKALKLAVKTCNYTMVNKLWKKLFKGKIEPSVKYNCGCYGN